VNYFFNEIFSSYKAIESLQKIWTKLFDSYGLVLQSLYELFEATTVIVVLRDRNLSEMIFI